MTYRLSDTTIAHIAQLLQLALITQTDITQLMRGMVVEPSELDVNKLSLNEEYMQNHQKEIEDLAKKAEEAMKKQELQDKNDFVQ